MAELRSILAATDLSAPARRAAERAALLAAASRVGLTLLYVVTGSAIEEFRRWLDRDGRTGQSIEEEARWRLRELAEELSSRHGVSVDPVVVAGNVAAGIGQAAEERDTDLIVTGTLGAGFLHSRIVGSTAERVVRRSTRPVLLVRQSPRASYRRALVTLDFSPWSGPAIAIASAVAPEADLVLLHSLEVPFDPAAGFGALAQPLLDDYQVHEGANAMQRMSDLASAAGLERDRWSGVTPHGGTPWGQIVRAENELDCDLVVMGKHGRNAAEDVLLGSTTSRVIAESSADVLVSPRRDASP
jgi:nucleotide-binding universal stress UspA family protein